MKIGDLTNLQVEMAESMGNMEKKLETNMRNMEKKLEMNMGNMEKLETNMENMEKKLEENMEIIIKLIQHPEEKLPNDDNVGQGTHDERNSSHFEKPSFSKSTPGGFDSNIGSNQGWFPRGIQLPKIDMRPNGSPPLVSHEPMFQISAQSIEAIQSYWSTKQGFEFEH